MPKSQKILLFLIIFFSLSIKTHAKDTLLKNSINSNQQIKAKIKLIEVNFQNTENDFLKFQLDGDSSTLNLFGLEFYDDQVFKMINQDFIVPNHSQITLTFNQIKPDDPKNLQLFTSSKGLTATTEQIILKQQNNYFDFFCWQKSPISKSEQADFIKIFQSSFWDNQDPSSCFNSNQIQKNDSLIRINSENNAQAWTIKKALTNNQNIYPQKLQSPKLKTPIIVGKTRLEKLPTKETKLAPSIIPSTQIKKTLAATKKSPIKKTHKKFPPENLAEKLALANNIDQNSPLKITEVFPAPLNGKKADEWLEIGNFSTQTVNLNNWIIDDGDGGSKPYRLAAQQILPNQHLLINSQQSKLNLNNKADQIRLFNPNQQLADLVEYSEAPKNQSYSLININRVPNWLWTLNSTPKEANPQYQSIIGTITLAPIFDKFYHFQIKDQQNKFYQIIFEENLIKGPEAKNLFSTNTQGQFIGIFSQENDLNILQLKKYQITKTNNSNSDSPFLSIIVTIILVIISAFFYLRKKIQWPI